VHFRHEIRLKPPKNECHVFEIGLIFFLVPLVRPLSPENGNTAHVRPLPESDSHHATSTVTFRAVPGNHVPAGWNNAVGNGRRLPAGHIEEIDGYR
jgi:hypothetical protein